MTLATSSLYAYTHDALMAGTAVRYPSSRVLQIPIANKYNNKFNSSNNNSNQEDVSVEQSTIRVGSVLSILSTTTASEGDVLNTDSTFQIAVETAAFLAMLDWNQRSIRFDDGNGFNSAMMLESCDFYMLLNFEDAALSPMQAGRIIQTEFFTNHRDDQNDFITSAPNGNHSTIRSTAAYVAQEMIAFGLVGPFTSLEADIVATLGGVVSTTGEEDDPSNSTNSSMNTASAWQAVSDQGVPNISPSATSAHLNDRQQYPFFARTVPTNYGNAAALCLYLNRIRPYRVDRLAVLYINDSYGSSFALDVQSVANYYNITVELYSYKTGVAGSLDTAIEQLQQHKGKYFLGIFSAGTWEGIVPTLYDAGLMDVDDKMWFFGENLLPGSSMTLPLNDLNLKLAKAINRTAIVTIRAPPGPIALMAESMQEFIQDDELVELFIASHTEQKISNMTVNELRQIMQPISSVVACMAYDAVLALGAAACTVPNRFFTGPQLYSSLLNISLMGATGEIVLDHVTGTRDPNNLQYSLSNLISVVNDTTNSVAITTIASMIIQGQGDNGNVTIVEPLIYSDGTTNPLQPDPEYMNLVSLPVRISCWSMAGIAILYSLFCALWTVRKRNDPIVRASQPIFLFVLCVGTLLMGLAIIPATFQEPMSDDLLDAACMIEPWLFSTGFCFAFAALFSKMWRINQVYRNARKLRRVQINAHDVLWPLMIVMLLNWTIMIAWTIFEPLEWSRVIISHSNGLQTEFGMPRESRGTCFNLNSHVESKVACLVLLLAVNTAALGISNYQSYQARNLPSEFNESTYIALTNMVLFQAVCLGAPVLLVVATDPTSFMLVKCLLYFIFCLGILIPGFAPKIAGHGLIAAQQRRKVLNTPPLAASQHCSRDKFSLYMKENHHRYIKQNRHRSENKSETSDRQRMSNTVLNPSKVKLNHTDSVVHERVEFVEMKDCHVGPSDNRHISTNASDGRSIPCPSLSSDDCVGINKDVMVPYQAVEKPEQWAMSSDCPVDSGEGPLDVKASPELSFRSKFQEECHPSYHFHL